MRELRKPLHACLNAPSRQHGPAAGSQEQLRTVISALTRPGHMSVTAGWEDEALESALVFRLWPARVLHVVGDSPQAADFRRFLAAGADPGWDLHRSRPGTPRCTCSPGRCTACRAATGSATCWNSTGT